jgi:hypothetical protein
MATKFHRSLKVVAFNASGISGQRCEFSKQSEAQRTDVSLLSETYLKPHDKFSSRNYHIYRTHSHPGLKGRTAIAVRKNIPHNHVDLPLPRPPPSIEATEICIPVGNNEFLLAAV